MMQDLARYSSRRYQFILLTVTLICLQLIFISPIMTSAVLAETVNLDMTPVRLIIPSIHLDATIEAVGQDAQGYAGVPQNSQNVAWYNVGPAPGEQGNAVISGHLDDKVGPAVFWHLGKVKVGDTVTVVDQSGVERTFKVLEVAIYPYKEAPLHKIFGFDLEYDLNLITCTGVWNHKTHTYAQRLIVYTRLVPPTP